MKDEADKVCPIMTTGYLSHGHPFTSQHQVRCLKEKCGIWDMSRECCGLIPRACVNTNT
jgi:hypothetical protein